MSILEYYQYHNKDTENRGVFFYCRKNDNYCDLFSNLKINLKVKLCMV